MSFVQTAPIGATAARPALAERAVGTWLLALAGTVLVQVMLGAITRLTGSGLSIMEWRPIMGAIPPLNDAEWQRVFGPYQQIADSEYQVGIATCDTACNRRGIFDVTFDGIAVYR